ncbi:NlpC/P60 family protein [Streptomyces sp. NPDC088354]|uniref:C40 family peptidase n=1 Tax=Streptomyces sp. NPDC088354 TaxID=3365856 RepID=UPI0037F6994D
MGPRPRQCIVKGVRRCCWLIALMMAAAVCCAGPVGATLAAGISQTAVSGGIAAVTGIPARMLTAIVQGAVSVHETSPGCRGMRWQILAGVATIESDNAAGHTISPGGDITPRILGPRLDGSGAGGNTTAIRDTDHGRWDGDAQFDRAVGPFQFLPATFATVGRDGNGDGRIDPHNAGDASLAAATYLCGNGRDLTDEDQLRAAVFSYNHSTAYVTDVLGAIRRYDATGSTAGTGLGPGATGDARTVIASALRQQGVRYSWGGGNAGGPSPGICCSPGQRQDGRQVIGFDCSGLTLYAYAQVGVRLPRLAQDQASVGRRIPASAGYAALRPGDLVFYGPDPNSNAGIHHVGIYLGNGQMINAPKPGTKVRIDPLTALPDYAGGARIL